MKLGIACAVLVLAGLGIIAPTLLAVTRPPPPPSPLAAQQKAVTDARAKLNTAKALLIPIRRKIVAIFEARPEWKTVKDAYEKARTDRDASARRVATALEKSADYQALVVKRDKAQAVQDASNKPVDTSSGADPVKISDEDLAKAGKDRVEAVLAMKKLEKDTEANDPAYIAAEQKFNEAKTAWDGLQTQIDDAVKLDPGYPPIQQQIEQAEAALKQAQDQLNNAQKQHTPRPVPVLRDDDSVNHVAVNQA